MSKWLKGVFLLAFLANMMPLPVVALIRQPFINDSSRDASFATVLAEDMTTAYCRNDPVNNTDPLGLSWQTFRTGLGKATVGVGVGIAVGLGLAAVVASGGTLAPVAAGGLIVLSGAGGASVGVKAYESASQHEYSLRGNGRALSEDEVDERRGEVLVGAVTFAAPLAKGRVPLNMGSTPPEPTPGVTPSTGTTQPFLEPVVAKSAMQERVLSNIAESKNARDSSNHQIYAAKDAQIAGGYRPDVFTINTLPRGSVIVGGDPMSGWFTDLSTLRGSGLSQEALWSSLQVKPSSIFGPRMSVEAYVLTEDVSAPTGIANANEGTGQGWQLYLHTAKARNVLQPVTKIELH